MENGRYGPSMAELMAAKYRNEGSCRYLVHSLVLRTLKPDHNKLSPPQTDTGCRERIRNRSRRSATLIGQLNPQLP